MNKPTTDAGEILRRIDRFCADADYTVEELKEQIREKGLDPDKMLENIRATLSFYLEPKKDAPDIILE